MDTSKLDERKTTLGSGLGNNTPMARANEVMQDMKDEVGGYVDTAKQKFDDAADQLRDKGAQAKDIAQDAVKQADEYVRENPWPAIGIAAAVGAVVALLVTGAAHQNCGRKYRE